MTIEELARRAEVEPGSVLDECSWLGPAIDEDAAARRFVAWGASTVVDEHTGTPVVTRGLFEALHERAGLRAAWPIGNAGLLHTYGYLLSTVPTPYGLKRERWLGGALAGAFELPEDAFVPWAQEATLLARVTAVALPALDRPVRTAAGLGGERRLAVVGAAGSSSAVVYGVAGRLITTFPVASVTGVLEEWDADPERLRWNAVADTVG